MEIHFQSVLLYMLKFIVLYIVMVTLQNALNCKFFLGDLVPSLILATSWHALDGFKYNRICLFNLHFIYLLI